MPSDEELIGEGMAVFRGIVSRIKLGRCTRRITARNYCPEPTVADRGLYCARHEVEAERDHRRIEQAMALEDMLSREDGWPLCPICGEDELGCLETPPLTKAGGWTFQEAMTWYRRRELYCYGCARVTVPAGW